MTYRVTTVRFISSSYNAEYEVTLAGTSEPRRVCVERDGFVHTRIHGITAEQEREYIGAVIAHKAAEHEKYTAWATARGYDVLPAEPLFPLCRAA